MRTIIHGEEVLLPDFLIIGAAKSGTTSLYFYLRQHPDIYMPPDIKEPGFLCFAGRPLLESNPAEPYPDLWKSAVTDRTAYSLLFSPARDGQLIGEATVEYLFLADRTISTIRALYGESHPGPKLIVVLRNPTDRLWSHYWMCRRDQYERLPIDEAIDPAVIQRRMDAGWHPSYDYIGYGFYARAIDAYRKAFGEDRLKVFLFEDLRNDSRAVCAEIFAFLGVDPSFVPDTSTTYNVSGKLRYPSLHDLLFCRESLLKDLVRRVIPYDWLQWLKHTVVAWNSEKVVMSESLKRKLQDVYRDEIRALEKLLGRDLSVWRVTSGMETYGHRKSHSESIIQRSSERRILFHSARTVLFSVFKVAYHALAPTPLRNIPGMLRLSNVFFRLLWPGGHIIDVQGRKMYIDVNDPNANMRKTFQTYGMNLVHEEGTTALFKKVVKPGDIVLDLGANIGYFTILAAKLAGPTGKVFSFEPEPTNFWYLTKNIKLNHCINVFAFQKAVSDRVGQTQLFVCSYDSGHHTINQYDGIESYRRGRRSMAHAIEIETLTVDEFLRDKIDRVDIIKMDVEGAEALALLGMKDTLGCNHSIKVFLEFFPMLIKKMGSSPEAYAKSLLNDFGFLMYAIGHDYAMKGVSKDLIRIENVRQLMKLLEHEDDHVNLYLTREAQDRQPLRGDPSR